MDFHIIPECYIDTKLIKLLVPPQTKKGYNHQYGCSNVAKLMQQKLSNDFAIGIVDNDKQELAYASEFDMIYEIKDKLQLLKHHHRYHYLIIICPAVERWLIECANEAQISLTDYGLPTDLKALTKITKSSKSEHDDLHSQDFTKLFKTLKNSQSKTVSILKFWVEYIRTNPYNADIAYLKKTTRNIEQS